MCGLVGFVNYKKDVSSYKNVLYSMTDTLKKRGPDEFGYYLDTNVALGHRRLIVIDPDGGKQPMLETYSYGEYAIVYNGQIYNTKELKDTLIQNGFTFEGHCDTEVLLKAFIYYGYDTPKHLNGIFSFAIWNSKEKEIFLARDHFGIKPLFYTFCDNGIVFGSEIKALFEYPGVEKVVDSQGICELFGIGPAHTPGTTVFKDIFEIKPAHCAIFSSSGFHTEKYWSLETKEHTDSFNETCDKVHYLLDDAIKRQLVSDVPLCVMLSRWFRF